MEHATKLIPVGEPDYLSINDLATSIRQDSDKQEPILREVELSAQIAILDKLGSTGLVHIPLVIYGALLVERDRVAVLADQASKV